MGPPAPGTEKLLIPAPAAAPARRGGGPPYSADRRGSTRQRSVACRYQIRRPVTPRSDLQPVPETVSRTTGEPGGITFATSDGESDQPAEHSGSRPYRTLPTIRSIIPLGPSPSFVATVAVGHSSISVRPSPLAGITNKAEPPSYDRTPRHASTPVALLRMRHGPPKRWGRSHPFGLAALAPLCSAVTPLRGPVSSPIPPISCAAPQRSAARLRSS